jgi:hypothetical protein
MKTMIEVQEKYIERLDAALARWGHRKGTAYQIAGGHYNRIARKARHDAEAQLRKLGWTDQKQIDAVLNDARDMMLLERNADE